MSKITIARFMRFRTMLALLVLVITDRGAVVFAHDPPVNLSGYETFIGLDCKLAGQPGTCGVTFSGWIGGDGPVAGGWEPFPGDFQGLWNSRVDYIGQAGFGNTVFILSGRVQDLLLGRAFSFWLSD